MKWIIFVFAFLTLAVFSACESVQTVSTDNTAHLKTLIQIAEDLPASKDRDILIAGLTAQEKANEQAAESYAAQSKKLDTAQNIALENAKDAGQYAGIKKLFFIILGILGVSLLFIVLRKLGIISFFI